MNKLHSFWTMSISLVTLFEMPFCAAQRAFAKPKNTSKKTYQSPKTSEEAVVQEIKSLLKDGKVPSQNFNQWVDTNKTVLLESEYESIRKLGETLQAIREGNIAQISAFNVLPSFEKAVQEYDPGFSISIFSKPKIIAKGTYWYFSSAKK